MLRDYTEIKQHYGDKIKLRGAALLEQYNTYIKSIGIDAKNVSLPMDLLFEVVLNYFADIHRIKEFHDIEKVNSEKIAAYTSYWILRIKPIQVIEFKKKDEEYYKLINEYFAANTLIAFLFDKELQIFHSAEFLSKWNKFYNHLMYSFHYRPLDPQAIELSLVALLTEAPYRIEKKTE